MNHDKMNYDEMNYDDMNHDDMNYDDKYIFDDIAYNLLPSEISAAFALVQLNKLEINLENRLSNYNFLKECLYLE